MKVLIADDEAVTLRLLESSVRKWDYEPIIARDGLEAAQILLAPDAPKLAIVDWMMPGLDGTQLCLDIRRNKPEPYTYILLLTGKHSREDIVAGLDAGADDYVTKPFDPAELKVRFRTGKRILFLMEQLIEAREALRDQATHDRLTGLWNRAGILDILSSELARAQRRNAPLAIALGDLDSFKLINDTHGHATGDEVLRSVSKVMRESVRRYDSVGRFGGEEFLIILPGCDQANALGHAERLRESVSKLTIETRIGKVCPTISLGVVAADTIGNVEAVDLIEAADSALYCAKRGGRNRVELALNSESSNV